MALKSIIESLDEVLEALRSEYKATTVAAGDGTTKQVFVLDIEGIDAHPAVANLKSAHERQKQSNKTLQTDLAAAKARLEGLPDEFDADAYEALVQQAEGKAPPKADEQVAQVRAQLEKKHATDIAKKDERIATLEGAVTKATIDDGLSKALDEAGIDPAFKPGAMALLKSKGAVKLVEEDGQFKALVETDMGPMPLAGYVKDWSGSDEGKIYVKKPTGGDASGSDGRKSEVNPWAKDSFNLTRQGEIARADPAKAARLRTAAGA